MPVTILTLDEFIAQKDAGLKFKINTLGYLLDDVAYIQVTYPAFDGETGVLKYPFTATYTRMN